MLKLATTLLASLAALAAADAPARATGVIEGTVKIDGACPKPPPLKVVKDESVCGKDKPNESLLLGDSGALRNVVVCLRGTGPAPKLEPTPDARVDQRGCQYVPHVQSVNAGTPVTVLNNDAVLHNIHGNQGTLTVFNVAMPMKGQKVPVKVSKPGIVRLQCDAGHTWMNAYLFVADTPWHTVTDDRGRFQIKDVPPGDYTLELWHEPLDGKGAGVKKTMKVTVADGAPAKVDAAMKLQ